MLQQNVRPSTRIRPRLSSVSDLGHVRCPSHSSEPTLYSDWPQQQQHMSEVTFTCAVNRDRHFTVSVGFQYVRC